MTGQPASRAPQGPHIHLVNDKCPTCDQPIPHERAEAVRARLAARDKALLDDAEAAAARRHAAEKAEIAKQHAAVLTERDRDTAAKVAAARADEKAAVEKAQQERIAELEAAKNAIEAQASQLVEVARRERQEAIDQRESMRAERETEVASRVQEVREALEKAHLEKENAKDSKHTAELQKVTVQLQDVTRKLEKKTSDELGEGAEVKLFEALKSEFEGDVIRRIGKGNAGADILHTVIHNGRECGKIVYDSKNCKQWRGDHFAKLVQDQTAAQADHAVLCALKFPDPERQLAIRDGIIIVNPARALVLVEIIRRHMIQVHTLRLSKNRREEKTAALYDFINSDRYRHLLERVDAHAEQLQELQASEMKAHEKHWDKQSTHLRSIQKAKADLDREVDRIIGGVDGADVAP